MSEGEGGFIGHEVAWVCDFNLWVSSDVAQEVAIRLWVDVPWWWAVEVFDGAAVGVNKAL
jgi:hypothetical protein